MTIMKTKKILLFGLFVVLLGSCGKFLDPYPQGNYDSEQIWKFPEQINGLIGWCYDQVNSNVRNYNDNEGAYLDGATDDAVLTSSTHVLRRYSVNTMTTGQDPFATYWDRDYRAIRNCNLFLKDRRGYNTKFVINQHWNDLVKNRLQGEAFALRAYFEWDLLQKFGGKGTNGIMLGIPIIKEVYGANDVVDVARNTYDECVKQILDDCDSAYKYLPIAHRDYLVPIVADRVYAGGKYWGRFDGISTVAIKAMVYLTWASPRFNTGGDMTRWNKAAQFAKQVIDFKMTTDVVAGNTNSFSPTAGVVWTNPNSAEIVMCTRYNTGNTSMERMFYPGGFGGNSQGELGATQEFVDAFPMANGYPITDLVNSGYDPLNPYAGRDPRFYANVFYNNAQAKLNNTGAVIYTFRNWNVGLDASDVGADAAGVAATNTRTNYYIKKFVFMGWNPTASSPATTTHSKFLIRWTQILLTFAEAANNYVGPLDATTYGMSARTAIQYLRGRKTYDNTNGFGPAVPAAPDAYLTATAAAGAVAFDALIKNERRIELAFEGVRFYDLRRWTTDANWQSVINVPVHKALVTKTSVTPTFTYDLSYSPATLVETRNFPSPYNPIPYSEMLRMSKLIQNEGWTSWN
jgi:starch-binding outer membrane protein, SusD/RagB family